MAPSKSSGSKKKPPKKTPKKRAAKKPAKATSIVIETADTPTGREPHPPEVSQQGSFQETPPLGVWDDTVQGASADPDDPHGPADPNEPPGEEATTSSTARRPSHPGHEREPEGAPWEREAFMRHQRERGDGDRAERSPLVRAYRERLRQQNAAAPKGGPRGDELAQPAIPGEVNWIPLGPSVVLKGQAATQPKVSGRVTGLAIAPGGARVYAATANGGAWRSDDRGATWRPLMNAFDLHPTVQMSDSLACGTIAIDPARPERVYLGSGEGNTAPDGNGYYGVGPVVSDDGGLSWRTEEAPGLQNGSAFYELAVDPAAPETVFAATSEGLYQRKARNADRIGGTYKPQAYLLETHADGSAAVRYWEAEGRTLGTAQTLGTGVGLSSALTMAAFTLQGAPWLLTYEPQRGGFVVYAIDTDGALDPRQTGGWPAARMLMPFELDGVPHVVLYDPKTGDASLYRIGDDGTPTSVWTNESWETGLTTLMPFVLDGVPHFLAYKATGSWVPWGRGGAAALFRWTGTGQARLMHHWAGGTALGEGLTFMPFTLRGHPYLLTCHAKTGAGGLFRWNPDGTMDPRATYPAGTWPKGLALIPFAFETEARFLTYQAKEGVATLYRWREDETYEMLWRQPCEADLGLTPFVMGYRWQRVILQGGPPRRVTSVVASRGGAGTVFFAARRNDGVYRWEPGAVPAVPWAKIGGATLAGKGRIALAVSPTNPSVLYAFTQAGDLYRMGPEAPGVWVTVTLNFPPPVPDIMRGQGGYDLAIAVSPADVNTVVLGGSTVFHTVAPNPGDWSASLYRGTVVPVPAAPPAPTSASVILTSIGASVHADVHVIAFEHGDANRLWVGCDGGVFATNSAQSTAVDRLFEAKNTGLATMTNNDLGPHPTQDAVLFAGSQDNGCMRYLGGLAWDIGTKGDGGYVVVHRTDPTKVLCTYIYANTLRSNQGGNPATFTVPTIPVQAWLTQTYSYTDAQVAQRVLFYAPLIGTPASAGDDAADRVAFGSVRPWISNDFGLNWVPLPNLDPFAPPVGLGMNDRIRALAFATQRILYAGTVVGQVRRYTETLGPGASPWVVERIDDVGGVGKTLNAGGRPVTSIAVDPANPEAIYVALGGATGTHERVWYFDGAEWAARSGPNGQPAQQLMDIQHNALAIWTDAAGTQHLYAGADLGVWHSADGGATWEPFGQGLPEAAVLDLDVFVQQGKPTLLRASTHGRGVFERVLDSPVPGEFESPIRLYSRDTLLDRGLYATEDGATNPTDAARQVNHREGTGIRLSTLNGGVYPQPPAIDFATFAELLDESAGLTAGEPARMYLEVNNRGVVPADGVQALVLLSRRFANNDATPLAQRPAPPPLPAKLPDALQQGRPIANADWRTVAIVSPDPVTAAVPGVVAADLAASQLDQAGQYCLVTLLSHPEDPFDNTEQDVDTLCQQDRKVSMKYLTVQ